MLTESASCSWNTKLGLCDHCDTDNCFGCADEGSCLANYGPCHWDNDEQHCEDACSSEHCDSCFLRPGCEERVYCRWNATWEGCESLCLPDQGPQSDLSPLEVKLRCVGCKTRSSCNGAGCHWDRTDTVCLHPCDSSDCSSCVTQEQCEAAATSYDADDGSACAWDDVGKDCVTAEDRKLLRHERSSAGSGLVGQPVFV